MTEARVPASVVVSLGLHAGALALFVVLSRQAPQQAARVVEGVDLLISAPKAPSQPAAVVKPQLSTMDFLKMALPSIPRPAALAAVPEPVLQPRKAALAEAPKLDEAKRKDLGPKLDALDLSRERAASAKMDVKIESRRQASQSLAALPRLEEVGRRRVKNLPQALALEERRQAAVAEQGLPALDVKPTSRRTAMAAVAKLEEAAPPPSEAPRRGLAAVLPSRLVIEERPQAAIAPKLEKVAAEAPKLERRQAQAAAEGPKKAVEIEGPLADRKVAAYLVPPFPEFLKGQGILEADVSIRFTVDESGDVQPGMRVTSSSGYGRLDKLAMESLRQWRFVPKPGAGVQWGVITFRFVLE